MVSDTSALLAWLRQEPECERIIAALEANPVCHLSALSLFEAHIVVRAKGQPGLQAQLKRFLDEIGAIVVPFDEKQAILADEAYQRFGKGRGHLAQLNMGDCASYALAKSLDEPLLFVGNDFSRTDIKRC